MSEQKTQHQASRPSFGDRLGFYAYMLVVGGGITDRRLFSDVVRRPELISEVTRPESESDEEDDGDRAA